MSRLSKQNAGAHVDACKLLEKDTLSFDEKLFVLENWQESAAHLNNLAGAFFTPQPLARSLAIEVVPSAKVVDLCAGIGALAFAYLNWYILEHRTAPPRITCCEVNADYVAVGRKILPEATWIQADVLNLPADLKAFDIAISNPPFGRIRSGTSRPPRYTGADFEYKVLDVARDIADYGVFLLPQNSCPFKISGQQNFSESNNEKHSKFSMETGIVLEPNCGIDTIAAAGDAWHGVSVVTEVACTDFTEARKRRPAAAVFPPAAVQESLFAFA